MTQRPPASSTEPRSTERSLPKPSVEVIDVASIRALMLSEADVDLSSASSYWIESRVAMLASASSVPPTEWLGVMLKHGSEGSHFRELLELLTPGEVAFFEDESLFETLRRSVLPQVMDCNRGQKQLAVWCVECGTGELPYSLRMLLDERFPESREWSIRTVATDSNEACLQRAKAGRFNQLAIHRGLPPTMLVNYFMRDGFEWEIREEFRRTIEFHSWVPSVRLPDDAAFDLVILGRRLGFLRDSLRRQISDRIQSLLRPGGQVLRAQWEEGEGRGLLAEAGREGCL